LVSDREIRRESAGRIGLDDVVRALASASDAKITSERVIAMIEGLTSTGFAARVRATAIDGALLDIPPDLLAPCLVGKMTTVYTFDLGFDWDASNGKKQIVGVRPGSAAARAGVHDGDRIAGVSISFGEADTPVELNLGSPSQHVEYLPRGQGISAPEFSPGDASTCAEILGKPIHP
jgi:predicted metalloprotease with PDZ domain